MATNRVTGVAVEALVDSAPADARVTGVVAEALVDSPASNAVITGVAVEVLRSIADDVPSFEMEVAFDGEGTFTAEMSIGYFITANFLGEGTFTADMTLISNVDLQVSFAGEGTFTADASLIVSFNLQVAFGGEGSLSADATITPPYDLKVHFAGEGTLTPRATVTYYLSASFADDAKFRVKPLKNTPATNLAVDFTDGAVLTPALFQGVEERGPFYFAWVNADETTFNSSMLRMDEDVFSFNLRQSEGEFASLSVIIKNPRIGLLAPARKVWAWLSYFDGTVLKPIFFGRLVALPSNIFDTKVTLDFIARPSNFAAQKELLANSLRVAPYYDPLFISPDHWDDPDVVLEARSALWHIDRVTHVVSISDVLVPEDGVIELTEDDHLYRGLSTSMASVPVRRVRIEASIPWTQRASGQVDFQTRLKEAWEMPRGISYKGALVSSYTFDGLSDDWPEPGKTFGNGWTVVEGSLINTAGVLIPSVTLENILKQNRMPSSDGDDKVLLPAGTAVFREGDPALYGTSSQVTVPIGWGVPVLTVQYQAARDYAENIVIDLEADMQAIMTMPGDDESLVIRLNANSASDMTRDGSVPLDSPRRNTFSNTARGKAAIEHLILHARAALVNRSRAVTVSCLFKSFVDALDVTLRKSLLIHDHRLPDEQVLGKVTEYSLSYTNGLPTASVTIQSAVGYGGSVASDAGEDMYIDDDYIEDYYVRENEVIALPASDVNFTVPVYDANDDGIDFTRGINSSNAARSIVVTGGPFTQQQALNDYVGTSANLESVKTVLSALPTQVHMDMLPINGGPFITDVPISVSELKVPQQINLESVS